MCCCLFVGFFLEYLHCDVWSLSLYLFWFLLILLTYWRWKYLKAKCRGIIVYTHHTNVYCVALHHFHEYDTAICLWLWFNWQKHTIESKQKHNFLLCWCTHHTHILTLNSSAYLWSYSQFRLLLSIDLHQVGMDCPILTPCCKKNHKQKLL